MAERREKTSATRRKVRDEKHSSIEWKSKLTRKKRTIFPFTVKHEKKLHKLRFKNEKRVAKEKGEHDEGLNFSCTTLKALVKFYFVLLYDIEVKFFR